MFSRTSRRVRQRERARHRYVFVVLVPANGTSEWLEFEAPKERKHWGFGGPLMGVGEWARRNEMVPVAAEFVYASGGK